MNFGDNTTISAGPLIEVTTFPSTETGPGFSFPVFDFILTDDDVGVTDDDGVPTQISQLIIRPGGGNDVTNWKDAINEVALTDAFGPSEFIIVDNTAVTANTITFTGIEGFGTLGQIPDNGSKEFQIWINLKSPMTGTQPDDIDNDNFVFDVNTDDINPVAFSSTMAATQSTNSGASNILVDVDVTQFVFTQQPPAVTFVDANVTPQPVVRAQDANGNLDEDYNQAVTVTNAGTLAMTSDPMTFPPPPNGILTFPVGFQYNNGGDGTLTVADADNLPVF